MKSSVQLGITFLLSLLYSTEYQLEESYLFKHFSQKNGLPGNHIEAMVQDNDGQVWIGTRSGLCKWDGTSFFTFENMNSILESRIYDLTLHSNGNVIAASSEGLISIKDKFWQGMEFDTLLINFQVNSVYEANGSIMAGTEIGFYLFEDNIPIEHSLISQLKNQYIRNLLLGKDGKLYIGTNQSLFIWDGNNIIEPKLPPKCISIKIWDIVEYQNQILVAGEQTPHTLHNGEFKLSKIESQYSLELMDNTFFYWSHFIDSDGSLWFGFDDGIQHFTKDIPYDGTTDEIFDYQSGLHASYFKSFLQDKSGNRWFGTENGIWILMYPKVSVFKPKIEHLENFIDIAIQSDGKIITSSINSVSHYLVDFQDRKIFKNNILSGYSNDIAITEKSIITASDANWVAVYDHELTKEDKIFLPTATQHCILPWNEDTLFLGSSPGMYLISSASKLPTIINEFKDLHIIDMDYYENGIIASTDQGTYFWDVDSIIMPHPLNTPISEKVTNFVNGIDNSEYYGTNRRLIKYSEGKLKYFTTNDGIPHKKIHCMIEDNFGQLWIGTQKGLVVLTMEDIFPFNINDTFLENPIYDVVKDQTGKLFFSSVNGIIQIKPIRIDKNHFIKPKIQEIKISGNLVYQMNAPLHYQDNSVSFQLGIGSLSHLANGMIKYRLEGFESDWNTSPGIHELKYQNLPPGKYNLMVEGIQEDGMYGQSDSFSFEIQPPFWKLWYFQFILTLILITSVYIIYQRRVTHIIDKVSKDKSPDLEISLFGGFKIYEFGVSIPESSWPSKQSRLLLSYLILKGYKNKNGIRSHKLSLDIWPDANPEQAKNRRNSLIAKIRKVFSQKEPVILFTDGTFSFNWNHISYSLDIEKYNKVLKRAKEARKVQDMNLFKHNITRAISLFGKDGIIPELYASWLEEIRDRLNLLIYNEVLEGMVWSYHECEYNFTIFLSETLICWESWHESAHEYKYLARVSLGEKAKAQTELNKFISAYENEFSGKPEFDQLTV